jgi:hypothetical protein
VGFEATAPVFEGAKIVLALYCEAAVIGDKTYLRGVITLINQNYF